jgi:hypothetical protein
VREEIRRELFRTGIASLLHDYLLEDIIGIASTSSAVRNHLISFVRHQKSKNINSLEEKSDWQIV